MDISSLPDLYTHRCMLRACMYIRQLQTMSGYEITVMCHSHSFGKQKPAVFVFGPSY